MIDRGCDDGALRCGMRLRAREAAQDSAGTADEADARKRERDHRYRKMMRRGDSPVEEIRREFPRGFPQLGEKLIAEIDTLCGVNEEGAMELLREIVGSETPELGALSGRCAAGCLVARLPESLGLLCAVAENAGCEFAKSLMQQNVDFGCYVRADLETADNEHVAGLMAALGRYSSAADMESFMMTCERLLGCRSTVVRKKTLMGLKNALSRVNVERIHGLLDRCFADFMDVELMPLVLDIYGNGVVDYENDDEIPRFNGVMNIFVSLLTSDDEQVVESACDFAESVVFMEEWNRFLRGEPIPILLDIIRFYPFRIKEHAIMVIVELLKSSNDEQIISLFSSKITEVILDFLEVCNSSSTFEILQAIFTVIKAVEHDSELYEKIILEFSAFENIISNLTNDLNIFVSGIAKNIMACFDECKLM